MEFSVRLDNISYMYSCVTKLICELYQATKLSEQLLSTKIAPREQLEKSQSEAGLQTVNQSEDSVHGLWLVEGLTKTNAASEPAR